MDDARLKGNGGGSYWKEFLNCVWDISLSEKVFYRQVPELKILNNLFSDYFDFSEIHASRYEYLYMAAHIKQMDKILSATVEQVLHGVDKTSRQREVDRIGGECKKQPEETVSPVDEAYKFIDHVFRDGYVQTSGLAIGKVIPPISLFTPNGERTKKRLSVLEKFTHFFNRFRGIAKGGM